jgi:hypothetical protein
VLDAAAEERVHDLKMRALQQNMPLLSVWLGEADCYMRTNAKPMRDDKLVADYADGNQCLLAHMHMRQRGGCFMISKCLVAAKLSVQHFPSGNSATNSCLVFVYRPPKSGAKLLLACRRCAQMSSCDCC